MNQQSTWLASIYTDPKRERRQALKFVGGALLSALLLAVGVGAIISGTSVLKSLVFIVVGALGLVMCGLLAANGFIVARRSGEDLLTVAVGNDGFVMPNHLVLPWGEIVSVTLTAHEGKGRRGPQSITVRTRNYEELHARTPEKQQWMIDRQEDGAATVSTGLGAVLDDEALAFAKVLQAEVARRQIPLLAGDSNA